MAWDIDTPGAAPAPPVDPFKADKKKRLLYALAAGLAAPRQQTGFLGGLAAGFSGGVMGAQRYDTIRGEEYRRQQDLEAQQRRDEESRRRWEDDHALDVASNARAVEDQKWQAEDRANPEQKPRYRSEFDFFLNDPQGYQKFRELGRAPDKPAAQDDTGINFTPEALDMTARMFAQTGQTPSLGFGKAATKARELIINAAAKNYPKVDPISNKAELDRNRASLTNVSKIYDAASAWEQTAEKNSDVMLALLDKIPDTKTRFGNKLARAAKSQMGDPDMAAFNAARETIKVEYARLLSSPGVGNAVLSDQARKEVEGLIAGDLTAPQIRRAIGVLRRDAKNRKEAYSKQINDIKGRLKFNELGTAGQPQGDVEWVMDENGNLVQAR